VVGVGEFEQFDGRAVFDYERDADAVGWAVRRKQDFAASKLGDEISHFKRDVRNAPDEIRDRSVRLETYPLHAEFAFIVADDKDSQVFQVGLPGLRFGSGNSNLTRAKASEAQLTSCRKVRPRGRGYSGISGECRSFVEHFGGDRARSELRE